MIYIYLSSGDIPLQDGDIQRLQLENSLVIFGGKNEKSTLNDLYILDLNLFHWKKVNQSKKLLETCFLFI
jgi:hypothetical protein